MQTETSWKISGGGEYHALKPAEMENLGDGRLRRGVWTFSGINYTKQSSLTVTGTRRLLCYKIPIKSVIYISLN